MIDAAVATFSAGLMFALTMTIFAQFIYGGFRTIREALGWGHIDV